jgi:uncharacterized membrane protein YphA (DoxX/SURF4 family)
VTRIADWWFAPAPAERLAMLRILIGTYALAWVGLRLGELHAVAQLTAGWKPVGLARVLDAPLPPAVVLAIGVATCVLLAAFVLGVAYRVVAPIAAAALTWTLCYRNSWGIPFHTENLLVLHVIALSIAPAADAFALARSREPSPAGYGWAIKLLVALTAATYLLAGIAKLRIGGFGWLDGEQLRNQIAIDNLRKLLLGDPIAPLATTLLDHPEALTVFCWLTVGLELGAPVALLGGRIAKLWAAGAWGFHAGVILLMNIWFPYPLVGVAFLPLLAVERPGLWVQQRWQEWRARRAG